MAKARPYALRVPSPSPGGPPVVFFRGPSDLLRVDVPGEAGRHRPVFAAQRDHARVAQQIQRVARRQAPARVVLAHQEEGCEERRRDGCIPVGPYGSRP